MLPKCCSRWEPGGGLASIWGRGKELSKGQSVDFGMLPWRGQHAFPSSSSFCLCPDFCRGDSCWQGV